jgi:serine/threonine-protein kinase
MSLPQPFGRYVLLERLGEGGMGTVFRAHDRELDLDVALKIPHPESFATPADRARFRLGAQAAARLAHPNLAWVLNVGQFRGVDFLTMRYVRGKALSHAPRGEVLEAIAMARTIALAMASAHRERVIHLDLKPAC